MSDWDEKAEDSTVGRGYGTADEAWAHVAGARWQREALLSDEAIERAARAMYENFNPDKHPIMAAMFRDYAKTALTAAIGGGDE